ncbi:FAD binding domain-containing protein [Diaporthe amygdali]|uniref:FAD binding domain-containing protein n=1 Tax=Phomopsis amygdali TaxID=1214568 RepID=UPI0022FED883|nr:FAD binding domain-containing protein [Diaporthe amygdali]KAJ0117525.1 FAD binding domain-containing protein [Diaporthe amygdali]
MLAALLARFGIKVEILDDRPDQTTVGRADGLQPKTIETFQMLRLGGELLDTGVKVFDICMWRSQLDGNGAAALLRVGREVHYPPAAVDVLHPFILLCHQGMVEGMFVEDLRQSGVEVKRGCQFETFGYDLGDAGAPIQVTYTHADAERSLQSDYLVGCDGARSRVRQGIPGTYAEGNPHDSYWGVLDGELDTDFPDIWSKTVVYSEEHGSVLIIPRERNLTRFYIEVKNQQDSVDETFVMDQARKIMSPYSLEWLSVEWFGNYRVTQRVAARFSDSTGEAPRVFIAGDASHTHSPKAAQGMNTSMHDSWNLGWKLNLAVRGLAKKDILLGTYEEERKKIAHDLIDFDYEHANSIAGGDAKALAENFRTNIGFISGAGVEYGRNVLNDLGPPAKGLQNGHVLQGAAHPGQNLPPAKATRYIDDNPVDVQLDIPILGQFRIFLIVPDVIGSSSFLRRFSDTIMSETSFLSQVSAAASKSYQEFPRPRRAKDVYYRPERYTPLSQLFTYSLITTTEKDKFELTSLPPLLSRSKWTVYLDNVPHLDTQGQRCMEKWLGEFGSDQAAVVTVRPDGYVGSVMKFSTAGDDAGQEAARCLESYYNGFLQMPLI